jgi:hypothetical protein
MGSIVSCTGCEYAKCPDGRRAEKRGEGAYFWGCLVVQLELDPPRRLVCGISIPLVSTATGIEKFPTPSLGKS